MSVSYIRRIERNINSKMKQIKTNRVSIGESNIGTQFKVLKSLDEASYEKLMGDYKRVINGLNK